MDQLARPKPKDRIIDVSAKLFYGQDVHAVGVDRICEVADVSKRTLYKHFSSKETLQATALTSLGNAWSEAYTNISSDDPTERITYVFSMLEPVAESKNFSGCAFMNTSIELRDSSAPAKDVAKNFKNELYEYFKQQAILLRAKDPDVLAQQLVLLFDGCVAWIVMRRAFPASTYKTLSMLLSKR